MPPAKELLHDNRVLEAKLKKMWGRNKHLQERLSKYEAIFDIDEVDSDE